MHIDKNPWKSCSVSAIHSKKKSKNSLRIIYKYILILFAILFSTGKILCNGISFVLQTAPPVFGNSY